MVDLGCGPADYLDLLPEARYFGMDVNPRYIAYAKKRFGNRGEFRVGNIYDAQSTELPPADIVMANAVVHHLDDAEARALFETAKRCLKPSGRLVTFDNYLRENQNPISRWLIRNDRGQHVRSKTEYVALAREFFDEVKVYERNCLYRVPYDLIMLECSNVWVSDSATQDPTQDRRGTEGRVAGCELEKS